MARLPRLSLPGYPQYIVQRGNNRQAIAACTANYQTLLALIDENARKFSVAVHAYVLMGNHFHLLATPETADGVPQLMQATGRRYVRYFNDSQGRTGTLWEGRYRSTVIQAERYLLACMAYMDLHPVHLGLVTQARDYPWSSHGHYAGLRVDRLATPHPEYWSLGNTPFAREAAYTQRVHEGLAPDQKTALAQSVLSGWALGDDAFVAELQALTPRRVSKAVAGRPRKKMPPSA